MGDPDPGGLCLPGVPDPRPIAPEPQSGNDKCRPFTEARQNAISRLTPAAQPLTWATQEGRSRSRRSAFPLLPSRLAAGRLILTQVSVVRIHGGQPTSPGKKLIRSAPDGAPPRFVAGFSRFCPRSGAGPLPRRQNRQKKRPPDSLGGPDLLTGGPDYQSSRATMRVSTGSLLAPRRRASRATTSDTPSISNMIRPGFTLAAQ